MKGYNITIKKDEMWSAFLINMEIKEKPIFLEAETYPLLLTKIADNGWFDFLNGKEGFKNPMKWKIIKG